MENKNKKTALVTGASRGIGKAIAQKLGQLGYTVYVNYNSSPAAAGEIVESMKQQGMNAVAIGCNVSQSGAVKEMITRIQKESGSIEVLVNNAGITRDTALFRMSDDDWRQVLETNLFGSFYCIKAAAFAMAKRQYGRIINISSLSSFFGAPGQANYAASKAGIIGLTRCLASEFGPLKITVNSVIPGLIPTDMTRKVPEDKMKAMVARIPLKRSGTCEEVAEAVAFFASDAAAYITGQVIAVDGGLSCSLGG